MSGRSPCGVASSDVAAPNKALAGTCASGTARDALLRFDLQVHESAGGGRPRVYQVRDSIWVVFGRLANDVTCCAPKIVKRVHDLFETFGHGEGLTSQRCRSSGLGRCRYETCVSLNGDNCNRNQFDDFRWQRIEVRERFLKWLCVHSLSELPRMVKACTDDVTPAQICDGAADVERLFRRLRNQELQDTICDFLTCFCRLPRRKQADIERNESGSGCRNCGRPASCLRRPEPWHPEHKHYQTCTNACRNDAH